MRLIDADALYEAFERTPWMDNADRDMAEELVDNAPTVSPWVKTSGRLPEKEDADVWGMVLATHRPFGGEPFKVRYPCVRNRPFDHVWWMPIPPLPEVRHDNS